MKLIYVTLLPVAALAGVLFATDARSDSSAETSGLPCCAPQAAAAAGAAESKVAGPSLDSVKELAGTWVSVGEKGEATVQVVADYHVTAGGKAVVETLFPKSDHEMVSVYYQDGETLWMTHYCMFGNHPRMKASLDGKSGETVYTCSGPGENFRSCTESEHMHEGRVKRLSADHIQSRWTAWTGGKPSEDPHVFDMVRVK